MATRWGILATGGIAAKFVTDLALLPDASIEAVGSRTIDSAKAFASTHGIPRAYGSWAELAADPDLDVIYVATPHNAHHAAAKLCLEAGKAVLCEKPITLDADSAADLVDTATARQLFLMEAMWMRTNPAILRALELVRGGEIGEVVHIAADFGFEGSFPPGHRMRDPALGGGALLDLGVYPVAFAHLFLGPPDRLGAVASLLPEGTDQSTGLTLGFPSGAIASLSCGFNGDTGVSAAITGTSGRLEVVSPFFIPNQLRLVKGSTVTELDVPFRGNGMSHEAEEVMRCLDEGLLESPLIPHQATLEVMRILDEARAQTGVTYGVRREAS
jgi:predicted dehydrogenase